MDVLNMTTEELRIKVVELESEYNAMKAKVQECIDKMMTLSDKYNEVKEEIKKRGIN